MTFDTHLIESSFRSFETFKIASPVITKASKFFRGAGGGGGAGVVTRVVVV